MKKLNLKIFAGILGLLFLALWQNRKISGQTLKTQEEAPSVDTYIPAGFVLIPIEIENVESLDSILGSQGVVDLFLPQSAFGQKAKWVARRIKILRAPLNPQRFAVLAKESQAEEILKAQGPFYVSVQNPEQRGTKVRKNKPKSRLILENLE